jgi:hypothetical protein
MAKCWAEMVKGDHVFTKDGRYCGEVIHVQPGSCFLDVGFREPTFLKGNVMDKTVARIGDMLIFTQPKADHGRA